MNVDLNSIALMVLITCGALIGAVNSRGTAKMVISYLLAFICLAMTAFNITQYVTAASQHKTQALVENMTQVMEEKAAAEAAAAAAAAAAASADQESALREVEEKYKGAAGPVLEDALKLAQRLSGYQVRPGTDDEYEEMVQKAGYYLGEARKYQSQVKKLQSPPSLSDAHNNLKNGADALATATSNLRRFYNAENSTEEEQMERSFKAKISQARSLLSSASSAM